MRTSAKVLRLCVARLSYVPAAVCAEVAAPAVRARFTLRDHLNRNWRDELVFFKAPAKLAGRADLALIGPGGKATACQWADEAVAFLASVGPYGESTYRLVHAPPTAETDLAVRETPDVLEVTNARTGIRFA